MGWGWEYDESWERLQMAGLSLGKGCVYMIDKRKYTFHRD